MTLKTRRPLNSDTAVRSRSLIFTVAELTVVEIEKSLISLRRHRILQKRAWMKNDETVWKNGFQLEDFNDGVRVPILLRYPWANTEILTKIH